MNIKFFSLFALIIAGFVLIYLTISLIQFSQDPGFLVGNDIRGIYTGGSLFLHGVGSRFYDLETQFQIQRLFVPEMTAQDQLLPYLYLPFMAVPYSLLALFSLQTAYILMIGVNLLIIGLLGWQIWLVLGKRQREVKLLLIALVVCFLPVLLTILQTQTSLLLTLAMLISYRSLQQKQDFRGGAWLSILLIKPYLIVFPLLFLLVQKRRQALLGFFSASMVLFVISLLIVGVDGLWQFVHLMTSAIQWGDAYGIHPQVMHNLLGFLQLLWSTDNSRQVLLPWSILTGILIALAVYIWKKKSAPLLALQWASLIVLMLLLSLHANTHDISLFVVPGLLLLSNSRWQMGFLIGIYLLLTYASLLSIGTIVTVPVSFAILGVVSYLRIRQTAPE